jgi:hypothetical protein
MLRRSFRLFKKPNDFYTPLVSGTTDRRLRNLTFTPKSNPRLGGRREMERSQYNTWGTRSRLSVAAPEMAAEWDETKNPSHLWPGIICVTAIEPYWWRCRNCGHSYEMSPEKRLLRNGCCPSCNIGREALKKPPASMSGPSKTTPRHILAKATPGELNPTYGARSGPSPMLDPIDADKLPLFQ